MAGISDFFLNTFGLDRVFKLVKSTVSEWSEDKCPQLGAALAYYTVFSLAPLLLIILAIVGLFYHGDASGQIEGQMRQLVGDAGGTAIHDMLAKAGEPSKGVLATIVGIVIALFGASGVFGQLQDALNTIWGVKPRPGGGIWGFIKTRFLSFAMVGGVCFLLLASLVATSLVTGLGKTMGDSMPGGKVLWGVVNFLVSLAVVIVLFAMIFKFLPDAKIQWRDVWVGAALTGVLFNIGKFALGLYLGSGKAASAYGAASSLITVLLWIYYTSQIALFGAEFTQIYANMFGSHVEPEDNAVKVEVKEVQTTT